MFRNFLCVRQLYVEAKYQKYLKKKERYYIRLDQCSTENRLGGESSRKEIVGE